MLNIMLDELKEVEYFKEITDFKNLRKYFKEIKRLKSFQKAEVYLEPKQASMIELFGEYT